MGAVNKDSVLGASLVLSVVSLVLLFGVTWYFQSSLRLLQTQVENDRELLLELKSQVKSFKNGGIPHNIARRQLNSTCQCKDGAPGPRGPEGRKGDQGLPGNTGEKGDIGDMGPRGVQGDTGFSGMKGRSGEKGDQGDQGFPGPRGGPGGKGSPGVVGRKGDHGDYGLQGPKGELGDKGDNGEPGLKGDVGEKGDKGDQGIQGDIGVKGDMGVQGVQGFNGTKGEKGHQGRRGHRGDPGEQGPAGLQGEKGATGLQGPQGLAVPIIEGQDDDEGGAVYVRWGHVLCPSDAEMVYSGFAAGAGHDQPGGGSNPQCLPSDPTYLTTVDKKNDGYVSTIYGAEYQLHLTLGKQSHQHDVPCAVCYVQKRSAVFMLPAKHQCPIGWTTEYYGYLMAERYTHHRSQYTCVDQSFTPVPSSSSNQDGLLFYPVEGRCGSLPCSPYDETRELTCSVCTK